jgi:hypothetical protein
MREKESHLDLDEKLVMRVCSDSAIGHGRLHRNISTWGSLGYRSVKRGLVGLLKKAGMMGKWNFGVLGKMPQIFFHSSILPLL